MIYEWDAEKAKTNLRMHGVSFEEAATVFLDALAVTYPDPYHSGGEEREITIGHSTRHQVVFVSVVSAGTMSESLAPGGQPEENASNMKKRSVKELDDDLRPEYDLSQLKGGVRGKFYRQATAGTNLVLIEPELADVFPDTESVNRALRLLVDTAEAAASPVRRRLGAPKKRLKRTAGKRSRLAASR